MLSALVALVPIASAECTQGGAGAGSIDDATDDENLNWVADGIWNCGQGLSPSMSGTWAKCDINAEDQCEVDPDLSFNLEEDEDTCSWTVNGEFRQGSDVEIHSSDTSSSGPPTANGECSEFDAWLISDAECLAMLLAEGVVILPLPDDANLCSDEVDQG